MDQEKFVEAIQDVVINDGIISIQSNLLNPPGRKPSESLISQSKFYNGLNDHDKNIVMRIISDSVRIGVWGFFCVLDGVRKFEDGGNGKLELFYERDGLKTLLTDMKKQSLHDLV